MRSRGTIPCLAVVFAARAAGAMAGTPAPPGEEDPRSRVVLERACADRGGERRITLFANGTLRRTAAAGGERRMELAELAPEELQTWLARLAEEDLTEAAPGPPAATGDGVEACRLDLTRPGEGTRSYRYSRYDALPLALARLAGIAGELEALAAERGREGGGLPLGYRPSPGDLLRRRDGTLFEVRRASADGRGVELEGVEVPLAMYVARDDLARDFVALEGRRGGGR